AVARPRDRPGRGPRDRWSKEQQQEQREESEAPGESQQRRPPFSVVGGGTLSGLAQTRGASSKRHFLPLVVLRGRAGVHGRLTVEDVLGVVPAEFEMLHIGRLGLVLEPIADAVIAV